MVGGKGAGKSTLLRILSTLLKPSSGTAKVNGFDIIEEEPKVRETIGVAFAETGFYSRMTVRENLKFFGMLHNFGRNGLAARVSELLQAFNLTQEADESSYSLNESQKKRLIVACAAVHEAPVLLVDVPTSEEDMITTRLIDGFLSSYATNGRTVIKTTRSLVDARLLGGKMAVLRDGFLVASGGISDLEQASTESGLREALAQLNVEGS